jgi:maltose/moltooligosaccharide transporter
MSFGFLGVQIGYSLQNGNASRILSGLGSHVETLSLFWLAAPIAGLIVQPIIGLSSDKTWTRLGRRIPFILGGSLFAALSMFLMPNSGSFASLMPILAFGAIMLLFMDTSFNVTMQPFRALVGDMINDEQRNRGYSIQSFLINTGAVIGSMLPFILTRLGVSNINVEKGVAPSVIWAFYIGGSILLISVLITSFTTKEYKPSEYDEYHEITNEEKSHHSLIKVVKDIPTTMWQLAIVQFFSWFALFLLWVYSTNGVAQNVWRTLPDDKSSLAYNEAANWVGVIFAAYSLFGALFSLVMARIATKIGRKKVYMGALILGGIGLFSMVLIHNQYALLLSMLGLGIAWAAILAMPYAILSATLPASRMGIFMGLFNATITIPQITAGLFGGVILGLLGRNAIMMLGVAGVSMVIAAFGVLFVKDNN